MKLAVIGAGGKAGRKIVAEAQNRGVDVRSLVRDPETKTDLEGAVVACEADDAKSVAAAVAGSDAVVLAVGPKSGDVESLAATTRSVLQGMREAGVTRFVMVGGAGTLSTADGTPLMDTPEFPAAAQPTAQAHQRALELLSNNSETDGIDWVYISPAARFLPDEERQGGYQVGKDQLLVDSEGQSRISYADYAIAVIDELEKKTHSGQRITVTWK